jgi:creatinine amidohydrolase
MRARRTLLSVFCLTLAGVSADAASVRLEDMTAPEVANALAAGQTTVIVPTGGTEQNGPHLPLGKHNLIVAATAERIAQQLGNALVAPVIAYVPEGQITPPTGHMRFAGTLSVRGTTFAALLIDITESLRQHGFQRIVFLGDSGCNQAAQEQVATCLNERWAANGDTARVLAATDYYAANGQAAWLATQGLTTQQIGQHAALRDTSEVLALAPQLVHRERLQDADPSQSQSDGAPQLATAALGHKLLELKIAAAVAQIRRGVPEPIPAKGPWWRFWPGLTHLDDFHHKMRKTGRHCERSDAIQKSARF